MNTGSDNYITQSGCADRPVPAYNPVPPLYQLRENRQK